MTMDGNVAMVREAPHAAAGRPGADIIPVTVVTEGEFALPPGAALVTMASEAGHDHDGTECLVCNTRGNVRVRLFDLLEEARAGAIPAFSAVIVDARAARDSQAIFDALVPGRLPAFGLRDHTVARRFRLASIES